MGISDKADDPTQMKWGWYQVGQDKWPWGTTLCIPYWVWIFLNVDEVSAPKPPPSCCQWTRLLQANMIDEWDALAAAGKTFLSIDPFNQKRRFCLGTFSAEMCRVCWWLTQSTYVISTKPCLVETFLNNHCIIMPLHCRFCTGCNNN